MGVKALVVYTNIMTTISLLLCLLLLQAFVVTPKAESAPVIEVQPAKITLGLTSSLEMNCSFAINTSPGLAALISLLVSRSNDSGQTFSEVASITEFTPTTVNLVATENIQADGFVNEAGESYIHLTWDHPVPTQGGLYQCAAQGMDLIGHIVVMTETTTILVDEPNVNDFLEKIRELENYTKFLEERYQNEINELKSEKDNCSSNLQTITGRLNATYTYCSNEKGEPSQLNYAGRWYFLSKEAYYDVDLSQQECHLCGGYLAEINDSDEHAAIKNYLNGFSSVEGVVIAGNDLAKEGTWILPSTNQSLPYIDWHPPDPNGGTSKNCLWLWYTTWQMIDDVCHWESRDPLYRFLCEVPHF